MSNKGFKIDKHLTFRPQAADPVDTGLGDTFVKDGELKFNTGSAIRTIEYSDSVNQSLVNNQVAPADITEALVDPDTYTGFSMRYAIRREAVAIFEDPSFNSNLLVPGDHTGITLFNAPNGLWTPEGIYFYDNGGFLGGLTRYVIKFNSDGTEDTAFHNTLIGMSFVGNAIRTTARQSTGSIVAGGAFTNFAGSTRNRMTRFSSSGVQDTAFYTNLGTAFGGSVWSIAIQPSDDKIIAGGEFTTFNSNTRNRLVRLNTDGTEDTAFYTNLGTGFADGQIRTITVQADGKILVGGTFTSFNGNTRNRIVRLNSDGTEDTAFYTNLGTGFNHNVLTVAVQADGKILVGGTFTTFNGNSRNYIVRLNSDGTEDTAFNTAIGTGPSTQVNSIILQSNGKIVIGGNFTTFNGNLRNHIVRLKSDGTEDTLFTTSMGAGFVGGSINKLENGTDGLYVFGDFATFNGNTRNRLVKIDEIDDRRVRIGSIGAVYRTDSESWDIAENTYIGDDAGVAFSVTDDGQVQYTTTDIPGSTSTVRYKVDKM